MTSAAAPPLPSALRILLVGCGNMGRALLNGWLAQGILAQAVIVEPMPRDMPQDARLAVCPDAVSIPPEFAPDVVVFAVKPQTLPGMIGAYARYASSSAVFLSIIAGKTIGFFEKNLGADVAVVRAMPNTPASIHAGITAACANAAVTDDGRRMVDRLLQAAGDVVWLERERLINPVTALSGSGPAYVFLLIETMARAGTRAGLPEDLAQTLARATVYGSGLLARTEASLSAEALRQNVTSPGGTTAAALAVLMRDKGGMQELFDEALARATQRAMELEA